VRDIIGAPGGYAITTTSMGPRSASCALIGSRP
jgi:hypothetical protein